MIYINNETTTVKVPKFNREYVQNKIVAKNQVTGVEWQFRLTDISTNEDYYEYNKPSFNCNDYVGSYDYQIMYNDIVLSSGIVVIEGDSNVILDKVEYQYTDYTIEYTPTNSGVIIPERTFVINENGVFDCLGYDKVDVMVEGTGDCDCSEYEEIIRDLNSQIIANEIVISDKNAEIAALETENSQLSANLQNLTNQINTITGLTITDNGTYTPEEGTLGWNMVNVNIPITQYITQAEYDALSDKNNDIFYLITE